MEFLTQSVPEAFYLAAIVIVNTMVLLSRSGLASDNRLFTRALRYLCILTLIWILFRGMHAMCRIFCGRLPGGYGN